MFSSFWWQYLCADCCGWGGAQCGGGGGRSCWSHCCRNPQAGGLQGAHHHGLWGAGQSGGHSAPVLLCSCASVLLCSCPHMLLCSFPPVLMCSCSILTLPLASTFHMTGQSWVKPWGWNQRRWHWGGQSGITGMNSFSVVLKEHSCTIFNLLVLYWLKSTQMYWTKVYYTVMFWTEIQGSVDRVAVGENWVKLNQLTYDNLKPK